MGKLKLDKSAWLFGNMFRLLGKRDSLVSFEQDKQGTYILSF
jgi:hypothetical protein